MSVILPKKKLAILNFLKSYVSRHGFAPTLSELARKFRVSSLSTMHEHLEFLEAHGFIKRSGNIRSRDLKILPPPPPDSPTAKPWRAGLTPPPPPPRLRRTGRAGGESLGEAYLDVQSIGIPLLGLITAGQPIEAIEDRQEVIPIPAQITRGRNCYLLKVRGDSMVESLIADGDLVVVEKTEFAKNGDTVVAVLGDGSATLKKFYKEKNYIRLQPANQKYRPIIARNVVIRGRVVGIIRKY